MDNKYENIVDIFINTLKKHPDMTDVFNPWKDYDKTYDLDDAIAIRCKNLKKYLLSRENAKYVLIAEAPGYQGCHFSGIPMTSERIFMKEYGLCDMKRSSDINKLIKQRKAKTIQKFGFTEPTSTIVWRVINNCGIQDLTPTDFVLWNTFPFHPHKKDQLLSNRKPENNELKQTKDILNEFFKLFEKAEIIPIGNVAANTLGYQKHIVRHPANGGKKKFEKQLKAILN